MAIETIGLVISLKDVVLLAFAVYDILRTRGENLSTSELLCQRLRIIQTRVQQLQPSISSSTSPSTSNDDNEFDSILCDIDSDVTKIQKSVEHVMNMVNSKHCVTFFKAREYDKHLRDALTEASLCQIRIEAHVHSVNLMHAFGLLGAELREIRAVLSKNAKHSVNVFGGAAQLLSSNDIQYYHNQQLQPQQSYQNISHLLPTPPSIVPNSPSLALHTHQPPAHQHFQQQYLLPPLAVPAHSQSTFDENYPQFYESPNMTTSAAPDMVRALSTFEISPAHSSAVDPVLSSSAQNLAPPTSISKSTLPPSPTVEDAFDSVLSEMPESVNVLISELSHSGVQVDRCRELQRMIIDVWNAWQVKPDRLEEDRDTDGEVKVLGRGATGVVHGAILLPGEEPHHNKVRVEVAVKNMVVDAADIGTRVPFLLRELFIQMSLSHHCVLKTYGAVVPKGMLDAMRRQTQQQRDNIISKSNEDDDGNENDNGIGNNENDNGIGNNENDDNISEDKYHDTAKSHMDSGTETEDDNKSVASTSNSHHNNNLTQRNSVNERKNYTAKIVMERMTHNLAEVIVQNLLPSFQDHRCVMSDVASGLFYLHHTGIVHRDLKPENILLQLYDRHLIGVAKISDFGSSRKTHDYTTQVFTNVQGTGVYIPPEVLKSFAESGGYRYPMRKTIDVWAYGLLLCFTFGKPEVMRISNMKAAALAQLETLMPLVNSWIEHIEDDAQRSLAHACLQENPLERPTMLMVLLYQAGRIGQDELSHERSNEVLTAALAHAKGLSLRTSENAMSDDEYNAMSMSSGNSGRNRTGNGNIEEDIEAKLVFEQLMNIIVQRINNNKNNNTGNHNDNDKNDIDIDPGLFHDIAECFQLGIATNTDNAQAKSWYTRAANGGNVRAMTKLARMLEDEDGDEDQINARKWYEAAAHGHDSEAQYALADALELGNGRLGLKKDDADVDMAIKWFGRAAHARMVRAKYRLGKLLLQRHEARQRKTEGDNDDNRNKKEESDDDDDEKKGNYDESYGGETEINIRAGVEGGEANDVDYVKKKGEQLPKSFSEVDDDKEKEQPKDDNSNNDSNDADNNDNEGSQDQPKDVDDDNNNDTDSDKDEDDLTKAKRVLWEAANAGDVNAQLLLGDAYERGVYWATSRCNERKARDLFKRATESDNARAWCHLGVLHLRDSGRDKDNIEIAEKMLERAGDAGSGRADFELSQLLLSRRDDVQRAQRLLRRSAERGIVDAMSKLLDYSEDKDKDQALSMLKRSAKSGNGEALAALAQANEIKNTQPLAVIHTLDEHAAQHDIPEAMCRVAARVSATDKRKAKMLYARAARMAHPRGMYMHGLYMYHEQKEKFDEINRWWLRAADRGNGDAMFALGVLHSSPEWYNRAVKEHRHAKAAYNLALLGSSSSSSLQNRDSITQLFALAALSTSDDGRAFYNVGVSLGRRSIATKCFARAADKRHARALYNIGVELHMSGNDIDMRSAAHVYESTDSVKVPQAAFNLAVLHERNVTTWGRMSEAVKYYMKAMQHGHEKARQRLRVLREFGLVNVNVEIDGSG